jgi:protein O-GlcNAc transferase
MQTKKVISFSLWGTETKYTEGAIKNIDLCKKFYPGWVCRFYIDNTVPDKILNTLNENSEIALMDNSLGYQGLGWRFQVAWDSSVDISIIRDCDSRLSRREAEAVKEWEDSEFPFHIMRDHPQHRIEILGGMWGIKKGCVPNFEELYTIWRNSLRSGNNLRGPFFGSDQVFLRSEIWPLIRERNLAHDEYFRYTGREKPFPSPIGDNFFVGASLSAEQ